jgi:hypothetical protein
VEGSILLNWPSLGSDLVLEEAELLAPAVWAPVNGTITDDGEQRSVELRLQQGNRFFRLHDPAKP